MQKTGGKMLAAVVIAAMNGRQTFSHHFEVQGLFVGCLLA